MHPRALTRRKLLKGFAVGALGAATLTACQPQVVEVEKIVRETVEVEKQVEKVVKETVVVEKVATAAPAAPGIIEIRYALRAGDVGQLFPAKIEAFNRDHPNAKAVLEPIPGSDPEYVPKLMAQHAAGTIADACWTSTGSVSHQQYAHMGILAPLEELVASRQFDSSPYYPETWESCKYRGKLYGLPYLAHPGYAMLVYNKTLFEQEGVDEPRPDWTLDDLVETAKYFTRDTKGDGRIDTWGFNPALTWYAAGELARLFTGYEHGTINPEGTKAMISQPKTKEAFRWATDLYQKHKVAPTPEAMEMGFNQLFMAGRVAMYQTGCWGGPGLSNAMAAKREFPVEWWVVDYPKGPSGVSLAEAMADCVAVTANTKHKDLAFELITYFVTQDAAVLLGLNYGCAGARPDQYEDKRLQGTKFTNDDAAMFAVYNRIMSEAGPFYYPANLRGQELHTFYGQALQGLWLGKDEPTDAFFDGVNKQLQDLLDRPAAS
jgi:ABC-type glycerol-3-phosphate transport system substrate-binding protein